MSIFKKNYQVGASNLTYKAFQSLSYFRNITHNVIMVAIEFSPGLRNDKVKQLQMRVFLDKSNIFC